MTDQDDTQQRSGPPLELDRIGLFLQGTAAVAAQIAQRNADLWTEVSGHVRGNEYSADDMTTDTAKAMSTAMDNLDDMWMLLTRPPEREMVAGVLPTVFLRFTRTRGEWSAAAPVWIRVPYWLKDNLLDEADVHIGGADSAGASALQQRLSVRLEGKSYLLYVVKEDANPPPLRNGVYDGIVALGNTPLASLRIVVSGADDAKSGDPAPANEGS
jgi:hypothetical protein